MALIQFLSRFTSIRRCVDSGDELPKIDWIAQVLMRPRRQVGMQWNHRGPVPRQVQRDGVLPCKPLGTLTGSVHILHHTRHQRFSEPQHQRAAVLQDVAPVRRNAMGKGRFGGSADREIEARHHAEIRQVSSVPIPAGSGVTGPAGVSRIGVCEDAFSIWKRCDEAGKP